MPHESLQTALERHGAAITASHDTVTLEQQDTEVALLCTKNVFLAHPVDNAKQTMEQQKGAFMEKFVHFSTTGQQKSQHTRSKLEHFPTTG